MYNILNDKMLHEIFETLQRGENYNYSDENSSIKVTPNGISVQFRSTPKTSDKDKEVKNFLNFCDNLHDDLFGEVCESFSNEELYTLQTELDTANYKNTIKVFTTRVKEIANSRLAEIINEADVEIKHQERIIKNAQAIIDDIHRTLDEAHAKYTI